MPLSDRCVVVFDLDDTLYAEHDFVASGYLAAAETVDRANAETLTEQMLRWSAGGVADVFARLLNEVGSGPPKATLIEAYRFHMPSIRLANGTRVLLNKWSQAERPLGVMTDGRSLTQRNKLDALGLTPLLDEVLISEEFGSEKPDERNYRYFEQRYPDRSLAYVGDNLAKDFVTANQLGWTTIGLLDRGCNIHAQTPHDWPAENQPRFWIHRVA